MRRLCAERGHRLVDFFVELGGHQDDLSACPVLQVFRAGQADVLLLLRPGLPGRGETPAPDLLERSCLKAGEEISWTPTWLLRKRGLLDPALWLPTFAFERASQLAALELPLDAIARRLDAIGFAPPSGDCWSPEQVGQLLRPLPAAGRAQAQAAS